MNISVTPSCQCVALSVNVNKVALLRNSRHLGIPSVARAAELCLQAGANGITIHPKASAGTHGAVRWGGAVGGLSV